LKTLARCLLLVLVGLLGAVPMVSAEDIPGGGGDTGVWILPRSSYLNGSLGANVISTAPSRGTRTTSLDKSFSMRISSEMGSPTAFMTDPLSGLVLPMLVNGRDVTIPASTLQALANASVRLAIGSILDANGRGYYLRITIDLQHRTAMIDIY
jgi:hypothetical protein